MKAPSRYLLTLALAAAVLLALVPAALGAPGATKWERTWNLAPGNIVYDVRVVTAPTGNVYLCACVENGATRADWVVIRYTSAGARSGGAPTPARSGRSGSRPSPPTMTGT